MVIWYLSDGKPGHLNQILGLLAALDKLTAVDAIEIPVASVKVGLLGWFSGKVELPKVKTPPDLIIAAGHRTHKALLALSKKTSAKSMVLMSPSLPIRMFDYVCAPDHDRLPLRNRCLSTEGAINRMQPGVKKASSGLILIGGPSSHAKWETAQIISQIEYLISKSKETNWTLTTSRRTPADFIQQLPLATNLHPLSWQQTDSDWLPEKMSTTEQIWVTPDSVSMVYEALTAQAKVGIFNLQILPTRVSMGIEKLVSDKTILDFTGWKQGQQWPENNRQLDEAKRTAVWLLEKMAVSK